MLDPNYYDDLSEQMRKFAADQLSLWPMANANYRALKAASRKSLRVRGLNVELVNIPSRAISTNAKTDAESLSRRPCFLCERHRPVEQQVMGFEGAKGKKYNIQLNPYPILACHFVIPSLQHTEQLIWHRYVDMLRLCKRRPGFTILYNGPQSGASAPDHFHFQAVPSFEIPLENSVREGENLRFLTNVSDARLYEYTAFARGIFVISGKSSKSMNRMFYRLLDWADTPHGDKEPRFNLISFRVGSEYRTIVIFRSGHRSTHYGNPDPAKRLTMSPGCLDMGGIFVTIERGDFEKMDDALLTELVDGVTISRGEHARILNRATRTQPTLELRILAGASLNFEILSDGVGPRMAIVKDGRIEYGGVPYDELYFEAKNPSTMFAEASFVIENEGCRRFYPGALRIVVEGDKVVAYNELGREDCVHCLLSTLGGPCATLGGPCATQCLQGQPALDGLSTTPQGLQGQNCAALATLQNEARRIRASLTLGAMGACLATGTREDTLTTGTLENPLAIGPLEASQLNYIGLPSQPNPLAKAAVDSTWGE